MGLGRGGTGKARRSGRRVVLKFHTVPDERDVQEAVERALGDTSEGGFEVRPYVDPDVQALAKDLTARAAELDEAFTPVDFGTYVAVDVQGRLDAERIAERLRGIEGIENAYVEGGPTPPPVVNAADDPSQMNQGYQDAAPDGIDAEFAWTLVGGDGAGMDWVDLEQGWTLNHEDLNAAGITIISGTNQAYFGHGTAVLGEVAGVDNTLGIVGIAPAAGARVVSQYRPDGSYNTAEAILSAVAVMAFGDVLLLEAQTTSSAATGYVPVEVEQTAFDAIRLATALGVVVVEAGANGTEDLDAYTDPVLGQILNRTSADFRDSGAIMVGASTSAVPHTPMSWTNFGTRIDCYAWGQNITTTGDGWAGNLTTTYTSSFGGTSGASPIVTGAAVIVQAMVEAARGYRFGPRQLREILSDPANGTASNAATDLIGSMPDLRAIIQSNDLNLTPDVYLRDFVGDTGEPHAGPISASPDIILRPTAVANPQSAYGAGSGTENSNTLGFQAEEGQDNYVYVRALNQGGADATNVDATVYWSPPATLITPNMWTLIGSATIANVPTGEVLTVSDGIVWPSASIPGPGHYCLVGILGDDLDPAPDPGNLNDWTTFERFIRDNNNVSWRNFDVVNNVPPSGGSAPPGFVPIDFLVVGAHDRARPFAFEVIAKLPRGTELMLQAPDFLVDVWRRRQLRTAVKGGEMEGAVLRLNPQGRNRFRDALFPREMQAPARLLVHIPEEARDRSYVVAVRQLYRGREVGRVTRQLMPEKELEALREKELARE